MIEDEPQLANYYSPPPVESSLGQHHSMSEADKLLLHQLLLTSRLQQQEENQNLNQHLVSQPTRNQPILNSDYLASPLYSDSYLDEPDYSHMKYELAKGKAIPVLSSAPPLTSSKDSNNAAADDYSDIAARINNDQKASNLFLLPDNAQELGDEYSFGQQIQSEPLTGDVDDELNRADKNIYKLTDDNNIKTTSRASSNQKDDQVEKSKNLTTTLVEDETDDDKPDKETTAKEDNLNSHTRTTSETTTPVYGTPVVANKDHHQHKSIPESFFDGVYNKITNLLSFLNQEREQVNKSTSNQTDHIHNEVKPPKEKKEVNKHVKVVKANKLPAKVAEQADGQDEETSVNTTKPSVSQLDNSAILAKGSSGKPLQFEDGAQVYTHMSQRSYARQLHAGDPVYSSYHELRPAYYPGHQLGQSNLSLISDKSNDVYFLVMVAAFCAMAMAVVLAAGLFAYRVQQNRKLASDSDYPTYGVVGPNNMLNGKCGAAAFVGGYFANSGARPGSSLSMCSGKAGTGKYLADVYSASDSGLASSKSSQKRVSTDNASANSTASARSSDFMANQNAARMYHYQHQKQQMISSDRNSTCKQASASDLYSDDENDEGSYTVYECPGLASAHEMEIKNPLFNDDRAQ